MPQELVRPPCGQLPADSHTIYGGVPSAHPARLALRGSMSYESTGQFNTPNSRRHEAREKARAIRDAQKKQDKRTRTIIQATVGLFSISIIGLVAILVLTSMREAGPGPRNMLSDGIVVGTGFVAQQTAALQPGGKTVATKHDDESDVIDIQVYVDYFCSLCGEFEATNGDQISDLVDAGTATVEIHPIAILDRVSQGTKYSTRAANAAACVANVSPDQFYAFHRLLFKNQPEENTPGLSDDEIMALAASANVTGASAIDTCITEQTFRSWVTDARDRALTKNVPGSDIGPITGTPTVLVNGLKYPGAVNDPEAFATFVVKAAGANFSDTVESTATPTPTPTPTK
jgi:protein-disulfide isomerase